MHERIERIPGGGVTSPQGFQAGATYAGLKTYGQEKLDFCFLRSDAPCAASGVFTKNQVVSPSVTICKQRLADGRAQAVVGISGCANTCVGPQGMVDGLAVTAIAAGQLGLPEEDVLIATTGIIGVELPMALLRSNAGNIELSPQGGASFARAIMTTDSRPKETAVSFEVEGKRCVIGASVKGVGMIHPDMATMLGFITTDAAVEPGYLQAALRHAVDHSLNMVTVDGDSSTNDSVLILANGLSGNQLIQAETTAAETFQQALVEACVPLAKEIAADGEGATKLIEVTVEEAASREAARAVARTVASSALVKCAVHGARPELGPGHDGGWPQRSPD